MQSKLGVVSIIFLLLCSGIVSAQISEQQLVDLLITLGDSNPMVAWEAHRNLQKLAPEYLTLNEVALEKVLPKLADPTVRDNVINLFLRAPESGVSLLINTIKDSETSILLKDQAIQLLGKMTGETQQIVAVLVELLENEQTPYLIRVSASDMLANLEVADQSELVTRALEEAKYLNQYIYNEQIVFRIDNNLAEPLDNHLVVGVLAIPELDIKLEDLAVVDDQGNRIQARIRELASWSSGSPRVVEISLAVSLDAHGVATYYLQLSGTTGFASNINNNAVSFSFFGEGISGFTDLDLPYQEGWSNLMIVAKDGSGQFDSVQAAIDAVPENNKERVYIYIKNGVYKEKITVPENKPFISLIGESSEGTILTYDDSARTIGPDGKELGTTGSSSFFAKADDFTAENITFQNTAGMYAGQAVAIRTYGDRCIFNNCRFLGYQDTLYVTGGRQYFVNCYIKGDVDFIFGDATAVFENCDIVATNRREGGYITAASTPETSEFGYLIINSRLIGEGEANKFYLGRPWRPYGAVAIINSWIGDHIRPEGWHNWSNPANEQTARYVEYNNSGPGAATERRVPWSTVLTAEEAARYTVENVLRGNDGWNPKLRD
ncbi:MAG: hypothetical protein GX208_01500 [Firmicutes bacterium]|nr:hypothetical protein [Bacillota bacterium]